MNRADCFITLHRKVQSPDHSIRKLSELHIRKVREVETGGQPTPLDDPHQFVMNLSHTGFNSWKTQKPLFKAITMQEEKTIPINFSFLSTKVESE